MFSYPTKNSKYNVNLLNLQTNLGLISSKSNSNSNHSNNNSGRNSARNSARNSVGSTNSNNGNNVAFIKNNIEFNNIDKLDEDSYERLKGTFVEMITSQNGSRNLQKVLKSTSSSILSNILDEVKLIFNIRSINIYLT